MQTLRSRKPERGWALPVCSLPGPQAACSLPEGETTQSGGAPLPLMDPPHPPSGGLASTLGPNRPVHTYGGQRACCSPVLCGLAHPAQLGCSLAQLELGSFQMQHGSQGGAGSPHSCCLWSRQSPLGSLVTHSLEKGRAPSLPPSSWVEGWREAVLSPQMLGLRWLIESKTQSWPRAPPTPRT